MRDNLMDEEYFEKYIAQQQERVDKFEDKLTRGVIREERIIPVRRWNTSLKYSIFSAGYSAGVDLNALREQFFTILQEIHSFGATGWGYVEILWLISIAIMFEADKEAGDILIRLADEKGMRDWLTGFLLSVWDQKDYCNLDIKVKMPYEAVKMIIVSSPNKIADIKNYLENTWYQAHEDMPWYDSHKKNMLYSGYWSYEAGAVVKMLGLEDSLLRQVSFYPYDLVHCCF